MKTERRKVEYVGELNVSNMVKSLKSLQDSLNNLTKSDSGKGIMSGVEKQIGSLDRLISQMNSSLEKGFSSPSEIKSFQKLLSRIFDTSTQVKNSLKEIGNIELDENAKIALKNLKEVQKEARKIRSEAKSEVSQSITNSKLNADNKRDLKERLNQQKLNNQYVDDQIKKQQQLLALKQNELNVLKQMAVYDSQVEVAKRVNTKISTKTFDQGFSLDRAYSKDVSHEMRATTATGRPSPTRFNDQAYSKINKIYNDILRQAAVEGKDTTEAFDLLTNKFKEFGVIVDPKVFSTARQNLKLLDDDLNKFRSKIDTINQDNLTPAVQKKIGKAEGVVNSIQNEIIAYGNVSNAVLDYSDKLKKADDYEKNFIDNTQDNDNHIRDLISNLDTLGEEILDTESNTEDMSEKLKDELESYAQLDDIFDSLKSSAIALFSIGNAFELIRSEITKTYEDIKELDQAFGQIAMVTSFSIEDMWGKYDAYAEIANEMGQTTLSVVQASGLFFQQGLEEAEALELTASTMKLATLAGLDFEQATSLMTSAVRGFHMDMAEGEHVTDVYSELAAHAAASVNDIATAMSRTAAIASSAGMEFETTSAMLTTMIEATQESPETLGTAMKTVIARFTELKNNVSSLDSEFDDLDYNKVDKALKSINVDLKDQNGQFRDIDEVFLDVSKKWDSLDRNSQRYIATIAAGSRQQSRFIALMENYERTMELVGIAEDSAGRSSEQFAKYADTLENKINRLKNSWEQLKLGFIDNQIFKDGVDLVNNLIKSIDQTSGKKLAGLGILGVTLGRSLIGHIIDGMKESANIYQDAGKTIVNKIFGLNNKYIELKLRLNIEEAEAKLNVVKNQVNGIAQQWDTSAPKLAMVIRELGQEMTKLAMEGKKINLDELINDTMQAYNLSTDEIIILKSIEEELNLGVRPALEKAAADAEKIGVNFKKTENSIKENYKNMGNSAAAAFSTAFTTSVAAFMISNDPMDIIKANLTTFAMTTLPQMMAKIVSCVVGGLTVIELKEAVVTFGISLAIQALITAATVGIKTLVNYVEEEKEAARIANDNVYRLQKRIDSLKEAQEEYNEALAESSKIYDEEKERWDKLSKANETYEELSSKISLTEEEQESLNEATNTLAELMPNLLVGYDSQNNAIIQITDSYKEQIKKQKEAYLLAKKQFLLDQQRAKINEIEEKEDELEQIEEKKKVKENALKTVKTVKYTRGTDAQAADIGIATVTSLNPATGISNLYKMGIKGGISASKGEGFWKGFSQSFLGDVIQGQDEVSLEGLLSTPELYGGMEGLRAFTDNSVIAEDILNLANEKFKVKGKSYKNTDQVIKEIGKDEEKTKQFFIELKNYYKDTESYSTELNEDKAAAQAALNTLYQEEVNFFYDSLSTELELNSEEFSDLNDEQKRLATTIIESMFLSRDDVNSEVESIIEENRGDTTAAHSAIQQYLAETFNINDEDFQKIISEIGSDEDLTETVGDFLEDSLGLSPTELRKNLDNLNIPDTIKSYLNTVIDNVEDGIKETQERISGYEVSIPYLSMLFDSGSVSSGAAKNLSNQLAELEKFGVESAENYLKGLDSYLAKQGYSNELMNYLMSIDLDSLDFISGEGNKKKIVQQLVREGYAASVEAAEEILDGYLEVLNTTEIAPKFEITEAVDVARWENEGKKAAEAFRDNFGNLSDIIKIDADATTISNDVRNRIQTAFDKIAKDTDNKVKFNIDDYVTGSDENGNLILGNLKSLNEEIKKYTNLSGPLIEKKKDLEKNEQNLNKEDKELLKTLRETIPELEKIDAETLSNYQSVKATSTSLKELTATIDTLASSYSSMSKEQVENGYLSASSVKGFQDNLTSLNQQINNLSIKDFKTLDISSFLSKSRYGLVLNKQAMRKYIDELIVALEANKLYNDAEKELYYNLLATKTAWEQTEKEVAKETADTIKEKYKAWQEALKDIKEKEEAVAEAEEKVREAEEKLLETQEKLQESYYGTAYHKNKTDFLYNYNTELEQLEERLSKAKDALDDLQPGDDVHEKTQNYIDALREEITMYKAQNEVIEQYIKNQKQMLDNKLSERLEQLKAEGAVDTSTNVSDFYYEKNGRFYIDYQKLNAAKLPDDITDFIEEQVENMNNYAKAYEDNLDKISDAEKEFRERQKKARDEYLNTENKVVELLKKKDQEELDSLKDKYDGMKEADDEYTDALEKSIKKQRDLRNQANQWDDLAEKEKKLSLQQRDTSGANAKEIKKAQEDIAKTRESLLDTAVDNIINNLKELYEEQEETRQAEIEYRQAILDNKNYVDEATAIINNWSSVEEAKAWFMQFDEEFINASDATIDKLLEDYEGYYNNTVMYNEWMSRSYEEVTNQTAEEIQEKTRETSETLTSETDRALDEIVKDVHEAQEQGRKDVEEAKKAVSDAKEAVVKATEAVAEALEKAKEAQIEYNKAIAAQGASSGGGGGIDDDDDDDDEVEDTDTNKKTWKKQLKQKLDWMWDRKYDQAWWDYSYFGITDETKEKIAKYIQSYDENVHFAMNDSLHRIVFTKGKIDPTSNPEYRNGWRFYATGGLVDYTGPAWVDGTPSNPEAFLSATDTRLIREFIDLATLQLNPSEYQNNITSNHTIGDQAFNININVESISSDYDVDQMIERMHEDILSITNEPGSSVMLHK